MGMLTEDDQIDQIFVSSLASTRYCHLELEALKTHRLDIRNSTQQKEYTQFAKLLNSCDCIVLEYAMMHDTTLHTQAFRVG